MIRLVTVFKALSDRNRFRVVAALLKHDELCACQITELLHVAGATASRHMGVLIAAGLVQSRKEGRWVYYSLHRENADLTELIDWVNVQITTDDDIETDARTLEKILACEPEDLCRKQRGEGCCPK